MKWAAPGDLLSNQIPPPSLPPHQQLKCHSDTFISTLIFFLFFFLLYFIIFSYVLFIILLCFFFDIITDLSFAGGIRRHKRVRGVEVLLSLLSLCFFLSPSHCIQLLKYPRRGKERERHREQVEKTRDGE